jgi:2-hydroxy-3-keto-5-methylthiopentenyl-1-phosphate phosphatase
MRPGILVSDFDGTMTRRDFYQLILERLPPGAHDFWGDYLAGRITHFDAIASVFAAYSAGEAALEVLPAAMGLDPNLRHDVEALRAAGWRVIVASAGCGWYIERLLRAAGVSVELHANPGHIENGRLVMEWPTTSRFLSPQTGIDKPEVVRQAIASGSDVAFAGDGPPDLPPALLVPPHRRFATGFLAKALQARGEAFHPFTRWSDVARQLLSDPGNPPARET